MLSSCSAARKEARSVIRNITGISVAIGIIFTAVWYAFPGQFISYRGDSEAVAAATSKRYAAAYIDPDELLNAEISSPDWEYFEEFSTGGGGDRDGVKARDSSEETPSKPSAIIQRTMPSQDL
jgi:hypothetical protein